MTAAVGRIDVEHLNLRSIATLDNLDEITRWLGTFRARLEAARDGAKVEVQTTIDELEARYKLRRAELS